jgi:hypothetical protein
MNASKRTLCLLLAVCLGLAAAAAPWQAALAAAHSSSQTFTTALTGGKPNDIWLGNAGLYLPNSVYTGKAVLDRYQIGSLSSPDDRLDRQELFARQRYLEFHIYDSAGKEVLLPRGLVYVYFNLGYKENALWEDGDLSIYYYDQYHAKWVECLANHLVSKGKYGRLACVATQTGLYALVETSD